MHTITPVIKPILSLKQKYSLYLSKFPKAKSKLSNIHNIFDTLNIKDKIMMKEARSYMRLAKENDMSKDKGRKAIKKPRQVKAII